MSNLARTNIYLPQNLFFEMQQFRQNYVCWFSGPYNTRKVKFSNNQWLEIWGQKLRLKTCFVQSGSTFYKTISNENLQRIDQKASLLHIYMKHWIVSTLIGFQKTLRVRGVGYKFDISPLKITIQVGYSHLVFRKLPLSKYSPSWMTNKKATFLKMKNFDLNFLHNFLSSIRNIRPPDVYKGKGIRYQKELIFRKEGKKKKTT
jgi:large subunit ribosomal protein L6